MNTSRSASFSSKLVNIGNAKDEFHRYKMPIPGCTKKVHRNSFKTSIDNLIDIASAIRVPCSYLTRYLGIELNTCSTEESGLTVLHGEYASDTILKIIQKFIKAFVLCPNCGLPEIKLSTQRDSLVYDCACCGSNGHITETHKISNYIKTNLPKEVEIEIYEDKTPLPDDDDIDWGTEFDKTSKKKRKKIMFGKREDARNDQTLDGAVSASIIKVRSGENIETVIKTESLNNQQLANVLLKLYATSLESIQKNSEILAKYVSRCQVEFLKCFEIEGIVKRIVEIFWTLYDLDIVDEESFLMCEFGPEFQEHIKPFIEWLKTE